MTEVEYRRAALISAGWARGVVPRPFPITRLEELRMDVGVYFACQLDGRLHYVGSVCRPGNPAAFRQRVSEHDAQRSMYWHRFWLLPLHDNTPEWIVRAIEGEIIQLLRPPSNIAQPRVRLVPIRSDAAD